MAASDDLLQQQEAQRQALDEQARQMEEQRRRDEEKRRQQMAAMQQSQASGPAAGIGQSPMMSMPSPMMGGNSLFSSGIGGEAGAGAGGEAGGGAAAGEGAASSGGSAWPLAVAALVIAHNEWAKKKDLHTDAQALEGRAFFKDAPYYQERGNAKLGGLGDEVRMASLGSSPADLFRKDTWSEAASLAAKGGILGNALKKIF